LHRKVPFWTKTTNASIDDLNLNLCKLRNIGIEIAQKEKGLLRRRIYGQC